MIDRNLAGSPRLLRDDGQRIKPADNADMIDPIIDRSPAQKRMRVEALRAELKDLGYSVVPTSYLAGLMVQARRIEPRKRHRPRVECLEQAAG